MKFAEVRNSSSYRHCGRFLRFWHLSTRYRLQCTLTMLFTIGHANLLRLCQLNHYFTVMRAILSSLIIWKFMFSIGKVHKVQTFTTMPETISLTSWSQTNRCKCTIKKYTECIQNTKLYFTDTAGWVIWLMKNRPRYHLCVWYDVKPYSTTTVILPNTGST